METNILIKDIYTTQKNLKRASQIPELLNAIKSNEYVEPITLAIARDNKIQVENGHHRLIAYILSGKQYLTKEEYNLILFSKRPKFFTIFNLIPKNYLIK